MVQMGQQMNVVFTDNTATLTAMGNTAAMNFTGAFISDGPGMDQLIAGLPLATDYQLVFSMPNISSMVTKQTVLKVVGEESYNGNDCWKVNITASENENDKTTLWINKATNVADKIESIVPAMGNAKMTYTIK
jgi:hypothetical protein